MSPETPNRPRVGIPWRTSEEEAQGNRPKIANYEDAVRKAGGEPVLIPLSDRSEQGRLIPELDAFVLPGSPADVEPAEYGAVNHGKSAPADLPREEADRAILAHAFAERKPVLAICYGCQLLNVYLGGTLIQDVHSELGTTTPHQKKAFRRSRRTIPSTGRSLNRRAGWPSWRRASGPKSTARTIRP